MGHLVEEVELDAEDLLEENFSDDDEKSFSSNDVQFSKEQWRRGRDPWRSVLIIKILGNQVGYQFLLQRLIAMWKPKGNSS